MICRPGDTCRIVALALAMATLVAPSVNAQSEDVADILKRFRESYAWYDRVSLKITMTIAWNHLPDLLMTSEFVFRNDLPRHMERLGLITYTDQATGRTWKQENRLLEPEPIQDLYISDETGGRFYAAREAGAVAKVYAEIDQLETVDVDEPRYEYRERFLPALFAGLFLILLGRIFGSRLPMVLP